MPLLPCSQPHTRQSPLLQNCTLPWLCHPAFLALEAASNTCICISKLFLGGNLSLDFRTACSRGKIKLSLKTSNPTKPLKLLTKCLWKWELLPLMLERKCPFPPPVTVCRAALQVMQVPKSRAVLHELLCCSCPSFGNNPFLSYWEVHRSRVVQSLLDKKIPFRTKIFPEWFTFY